MLRKTILIWNSVVFSIWLTLPFHLAGTVFWPAGWLHLGIVIAGVVGESIHVSRRNPGLKKRRAEIGEGTKPWDLVWNLIFWPFMASIAITGGTQYGTSGSTLPVWWCFIGAAVMSVGFAMSATAMGSNPFFEGTVRIQTDARHCVFEGGPYQYIRHPGYLGLILWAAGTPMLLLSTWALIAAAATNGWIIARTALEDHTLKNELPGYRNYTHRTRFRLFPGIW